MRAHASIVAAPGPTGTRYPILRSDPPLLLRPTPDGVQLVGGAAGPLGGDQLRLDVCVEPGGHLNLGSAAATVVLPGPTASEVELRVRVSDGAHLTWSPEPLISVRGSQHRVDAHIELGQDATLRWDESIVLGRSGEPPGQIASHLRVERAGRVLHHQGLELGANTGWRSAAVVGSCGVVRTVIEVGPPSWTAVHSSLDQVWAAGLALAADAMVMQVIGPDTVSVSTAAADLIPDKGLGFRDEQAS